MKEKELDFRKTSVEIKWLSLFYFLGSTGERNEALLHSSSVFPIW